MDRNFYDNDFEEILKQKADQHKMYPADRVWNNIYSSLHGRRRRMIVLGFTSLFIISSLFISREVVISNYNKIATQLNNSPETLTASGTNTIIAGLNNRSSHFHQTIFTSRIKPVDNNSTGYSAAASKQIVAANIENADKAAGTVTASHDVTLIMAAAEKPLVIENNLLPAVAEISSNANTILSSADEKEPVPGKSVATKIVPLKENKTGAVLQNDIAAIKPVKPAKFFLQLYGSPIISYRRLSNENAPNYNAAPVSASYAGNINKYVHHQPAPGFEFGGKVLYKLSNSLSVYAGAQLNYSRYYIDAYKYSTEKASIELKGSRTDTLSGYTNIRNFSGYEPEQLQNQYWQLSVPVGIEIKLLGEKKLQLNVAGGFQPTFLINSNSYLISSDYKNYIQSPDLARSFNVHTNFEAFFSYQSGGFKWQLGPQFRSQLLSSYSNQYRVREYLTEFGIKFGITKTIK